MQGHSDRVHETTRQLNKTRTTLVTDIIKLLSETIMKILTLDSRKPSVPNRVSEPFGCPVVSYLLFCYYELLTTSRIITNDQLMLCLEKSDIGLSPQNL